MKDYYEMLQVHPGASDTVIHAAHKALMKIYHPDINPSFSNRATAINEAYAVLGDNIKRKQYDEKRFANPKQIGDFILQSQIAEGGFGITYIGKHVLTEGLTCIKHMSNISPDDRAIMMRETQVMWDLRHHSLPAVRNLIALEDGSLALAMSYIEGRTIEKVVTAYHDNNFLLEPEICSWIIHRVLQALQYLHYNGVVHGDIKPQNIIVQDDKHAAYLVDFGLSVAKPDSTNRPAGYTEVFAPPEQVKGKPLLPQADFYSLGMTMIYMLNGGDATRTMRHEIPGKVPAPLSNFIKKLTKRNPLDRLDEKSSYIDEFAKIRTESFGRATTGLIKLKV